MNRLTLFLQIQKQINMNSNNTKDNLNKLNQLNYLKKIIINIYFLGRFHLLRAKVHLLNLMMENHF